MNALALSSTVLLLPAVAVLLTRIIFCRYPWQLCTSVADWLLLPFYGFYILIILTWGHLIRCAWLWESRSARDASADHSSPRRFPPHGTTSPT